MHNEAEKAVHKEVKMVEGEQGMPSAAGSEPPKSYGHGSMKSEGVGSSIPGEAGMPSGSKKSY